jgi:hypothetical protein
MAIIRKEWSGDAKHGWKYPWDDWLDGQVRELEAGKDFSVSIPVLRAQVSQAARRRNVKTRTSQLKNGNLLLQRL